VVFAQELDSERIADFEEYGFAVLSLRHAIYAQTLPAPTISSIDRAAPNSRTYAVTFVACEKPAAKALFAAHTRCLVCLGHALAIARATGDIRECVTVETAIQPRHTAGRND
jgi:hypothetical protein